MTITIPVASTERAKHIENYNFAFIKINSVTQREDGDIYDVEIQYPDSFGAEKLASDLFGCGVSFGLDLKYSSYGTEPERVR
jgi:hypothetical protein